jgi:hypothetical protein
MKDSMRREKSETIKNKNNNIMIYYMMIYSHELHSYIDNICHIYMVLYRNHEYIENNKKRKTIKL